MSKVLVDRELLCHALSGGVKGEHARSELRGMLSRAQPAEAEGVRDYLTEFAEGEVEAKTAIEELQDALSAVTAERDRVLAEREGKVLAPTEPTEAMLTAYSTNPNHVASAGAIYRAMLSAAMAAKEA